MGKQLNVLEGPGNAQPGNGIGFFAGYGTALKQNVSPARLIQTGYAVEEGGLSRPVGTDDGKDLTLVHGKTDIFQRPDAAKGNGQGLHPEKSLVHII
jgi:hypothetical protein